MPSKLRVGAVNYLNSKPLIERLTEFSPQIDLTLDLPSKLADRMAAGALDVGLIPVIEFFRGDGYSFVPNIAIGSRGPVLSVTLFSRVPWREIRSVAPRRRLANQPSRRKLLRKRYGVNPTICPLPIHAAAEESNADAVLLIGDRPCACLPGFRYAYDLEKRDCVDRASDGLRGGPSEAA